jgi:hypothetical protein
LSSVDSSVLTLDCPLFGNIVTVVGTESFNKFIALIPTVERAVGLSKDEVEFSAFCSGNSSTFLNYDLEPSGSYPEPPKRGGKGIWTWC